MADALGLLRLLPGLRSGVHLAGSAFPATHQTR
jgi:hypothetical protein